MDEANKAPFSNDPADLNTLDTAGRIDLKPAVDRRQVARSPCFERKQIGFPGAGGLRCSNNMLDPTTASRFRIAE